MAERSQGGGKASLTGTLHDSTIVEDAEDENMARGSCDASAAPAPGARVSKSPSLPFARRKSQRERRSLGMFRSVRRLRPQQQQRLASLEGEGSSLAANAGIQPHEAREGQAESMRTALRRGTSLKR